MAKPLSFIVTLRRRIASAAIGASTIRRMGPKGTAKRARAFLAGLNLNRFRVDSKQEFIRVLDNATDSFLGKLPRRAKHWGLARKLLNIFLRDAAYNRYLSQHFALRRVERWMEVPLDSHVGKQLRASLEGKNLPRWKTVIGLGAEVSKKFQKVATTIARRKGVTRVDLDVYYWRNPNMAKRRIHAGARRLVARK
ncbi:MAG: hypothetical protein HYY78_22420 [Betaproteobacteria bacterium]|nr:hypothetical protein [Betaproteobacteria bacterium]